MDLETKVKSSPIWGETKDTWISVLFNVTCTAMEANKRRAMEARFYSATDTRICQARDKLRYKIRCPRRMSHRGHSRTRRPTIQINLPYPWQGQIRSRGGPSQVPLWYVI